MRPAFSEEELKITGWHKGARSMMPDYARPITPRENLRLLLTGQTPWWMPIVGVGSGEMQILHPRMFPDNMARRFCVDGEPPMEFGDDLLYRSWFDVVWEYVPQVRGATMQPGAPRLSCMADWEELTFPDPDALDWERSAEANRAYLQMDGTRQMGFLTTLWERLMSLLDVENAAVALVDEDEQEEVHRFFDRLCTFYEQLFDRFVRYFDIDMMHMHDDWGTQNGPFFSPETHREMILPYMKRLVDACHARGLLFELHCCGKNELLVPNMIEAGVDLWCGQDINDFDLLAHEYKDAPIVFGVSPPALSADATPEQAAAAAAAFLEQYRGCRVACRMNNEPQYAPFFDALYAQSRELFRDA